MKHRNSKGLTLIEMMVVITLLGILVAMFANYALNAAAGARIKATKAGLETTRKLLEIYKLYENRYPEKLDVLRQPSPNNWNKSYVEKRSELQDAWKHDYVYEVPGPDGKAYNLTSLGDDGKRGGTGENADISVWDEEEPAR